MSVTGFDFELGASVVLVISRERGFVIGRAEYRQGASQYQVHYKDNHGCAKTEWFYESQLDVTPIAPFGE